MPSWAKEGFTVEPQCKPKSGPMRAEHDWDDEVGVCTVCGVKRSAATSPSVSPWPATRPIVAPPPGAADGVRRSAGGKRKPTLEQRMAFGSGTLSPAPPPQSRAVEDLATIPDPAAAVLAELELERDELEVAIDTLKRRQARKAAHA
jgi:hypothetical protein